MKILFGNVTNCRATICRTPAGAAYFDDTKGRNSLSHNMTHSPSGKHCEGFIVAFSQLATRRYGGCLGFPDEEMQGAFTHPKQGA